jgi:hypothetical protein
MSDRPKTIVDAINEALQAPIAELHAWLIAHERAMHVLIAALDKAGALPIAAAKSEFDAAAASLPEGPLNRQTAELLRRLSKALEPLVQPPVVRH